MPCLSVVRYEVEWSCLQGMPVGLAAICVVQEHGLTWSPPQLW